MIFYASFEQEFSEHEDFVLFGGKTVTPLPFSENIS